MRVDIMVDIETLGKKSNSTIFQIAAIAFDIKTGETIDTFNLVADISRNGDNMVVDGDTLQWWLNTDALLLKKLLTEHDNISSENMLRQFHAWITCFENDKRKREDIYLWGNGILFDNKMIQQQLNQLRGFDYPIHYKNDRDVRTILDLASAKTGFSEKQLKAIHHNPLLIAHDAIDDCKQQINLVVGCYDILTSKLSFEESF